MSNVKINKKLLIGEVIKICYKTKEKVFVEEAMLVDNYILERLVRQIKGTAGVYERVTEIFVFENKKGKRFVLSKSEVNDYEKIPNSEFKESNYSRLGVGRKVKIIGNIYGVRDPYSIKSGTIGIISKVYKKRTNVKMARVIVTDLITKEERKVSVPLVNCIALGK